MASTNRTGRVSAIDYEAGTYEVTYFDRGKSVTRQINAMSNGEYKMPCVGQVVSVAHNSNGTAAGTTTGTVWNKTNKPAEGYKGLYRKEYGTSRKGQAYSRYDENTGVYTQYVDKRTGRTCNGEIFDEAKGPVSVIAGGQLQLKSSGASASIQAKTGMGKIWPRLLFVLNGGRGLFCYAERLTKAPQTAIFEWYCVLKLHRTAEADTGSADIGEEETQCEPIST